jgi:arsenate reductase
LIVKLYWVGIYHNPACETSRTCSRNAGVEPHTIEYLKFPPTRLLLAQLLERAGLSVCQILREKGTPYHDLGLGDALLLEDALLEAIGAHPMLMNRPLVISPKGVRLCRPSEKVLDFLPPQRGQFIQLFSPHRDRHFLNALEETAGRKGLLRPASCVNGPVWGVDWQRKFSVPIVCRRRPLQTLQPWLRTG